MKKLAVIIVSFIFSACFAQGTYQIAYLKYNGGGDYYANPTALANLVQFCNTNLHYL
jgi:hypothetical protein